MSDIRLTDLRIEREAARAAAAEKKTLALVKKQKDAAFLVRILGLDGAPITLASTLKDQRGRDRRTTRKKVA